MSRGQIVKALSGFYYVAAEEGGIIRCRARGKFRKDGMSPLVGDWVEVREIQGDEVMVWAIGPRKDAFARPAVANIDQLVVVASQAIPQTDPFLIDRVSSIAALKGCPTLLVLNKCDLDRADELREIYEGAGITTVTVSAETGEGISDLIPLLQGKLSAFTGNSGVGKSSILNAIEPSFSISTGEVSEKLGRGRHTTREVTIFEAFGGRIADTPGFASLEAGRAGFIPKENLEHAFPEFGPYLGKCQFTGCSHRSEKGCAIRAALAAGELSPTRYDSYCAMYDEVKDVKDWQQPRRPGAE